MLRSWIVLACCLGLLLPTVGSAAGSLGDFKIRFALNSAEVSPRYQPDVAELAKYLKSHPQTKITLAGHTDASGSQQLNVRLSHDRAAAVRDWLVNEYAIAKGRVGIAWLDSTRPVAGNDSDTGMARNRRVSIAFIASTGLTAKTTRSHKVVVKKPRPAISNVRTSSVRRPAVKKPTAKPPVKTAKVIGPAIETGVLQELPLHYSASDSVLTAEGNKQLAEVAALLKANPQQTLKIQGLSRGSSGLQLTRKRVDAVRARLLYGLKVPSRQLQVSWFGAVRAAAQDSNVGVLLQLTGVR